MGKVILIMFSCILLSAVEDKIVIMVSVDYRNLSVQIAQTFRRFKIALTSQ